MYCANCGVKLADSEQRCPLCHTRAFHPDLLREEGEPLYPSERYPTAVTGSKWPHIIVTALFLLPLFVVFLCDWQFNGAVTWSGFVIGALLVLYVTAILPTWFRKPNPVIFFPCGFAAVGVYLLYISVATHGGWFLSFAFPVTGGVGLIVTALVALLWYVRRGKLYIVGGATAAMGLFMPVVEWLMSLTFAGVRFVGWSLYPLVALVLLGGLLIFLAICRPARETMERKFFI